jgi:DNA-directed RNA polymerase specialized sigma24 family protein
MVALLTTELTSPPSARPTVGDPNVVIDEALSHAGPDELVANLLERVRAGEPGAFPELIERCEPIVRNAARRHLRQRSDVDDVVQEVWLALVKHLHRITSPTSLGGWLWVVATHAAIRQGKRSARVTSLIGEGDLLASGAWADDDHGGRLGPAGCQGVRDALGKLKPSDRELLELLFATERPSYRAISHSVQRPVGSIGPTRQRLLNRLREDPAIQALHEVACSA